jgi:hypothetical protein
MRTAIICGALVALAGCVSDQEAAVQAAKIAAPPPGPDRTIALKAKALGLWRHVPEPASPQRFERDSARCRAQMQLVPIDYSRVSPAVVEITLYSFFIDCMKAEGYVPDGIPGAKLP